MVLKVSLKSHRKFHFGVKLIRKAIIWHLNASCFTLFSGMPPIFKYSDMISYMWRTWRICGIHGVHVAYMYATWRTCGVHGVHVAHTWCTCRTWRTCGIHGLNVVYMVHMWRTRGVHVAYMWRTRGVHVAYMWLACGLHGVHVVHGVFGVRVAYMGVHGVHVAYICRTSVVHPLLRSAGKLSILVNCTFLL